MGYGHIGKLHENVLNKSTKGQLVAIIDDVDIDSPFPKFNNIQALKSSKLSIDTIIIATPNGLHFRHAKEALENGFHVIVEKPITLNVQDLERLLYIAEQHKLRIFNMLQLRFSPVVLWLKDVLNKNLLGDIFLVNIQCYWNRNAEYYGKREWHGTNALDGGVLFTQFSHFVDVMHFWFEELKPKDVRTFNFNHQDSTEFADSGLINFEIPHGGFGSMTYTISTFEKNFDSTITIIAAKGTLQIGGQYMNQINYLNAENVANPFTEPIGKIFHQNALEEIIDAVAQNRPSILDAENARNVIKFLEVVS